MHKGGHLVLVGIPAWGNLRPLAVFAAKIVSIQADSPPESRTTVTLLTTGELTDKVKKEIALVLDGISFEEQIRVVSIGGEGSDYRALITVLYTQFPQYYDLLLTERPLTCKRTGNVYDAVPKPKTAIIAVTATPIYQAISASKTPIPILTWAPLSALYTFRTQAPAELGGLGDAYANLVEEIIKGDKTEDELNAMVQKDWLPTTGRVIKIPGLQQFYDYEKSPQQPSTFLWTPSQIRTIHHGVTHCVGMIIHTTPTYEPEALPAVRSLFEKSGKKLFALGPLVPSPKAWAGGHEGGSSLEGPGRVIAFLDAIFKSHGSHSAIYISFGTAYWPTNPQFLRAWIEGLLELGTPFILSTASMTGNLPDDLRSPVEKSDHGILSAWAPQQAILTHPATGWLMSHCGHNSIMEAMSSGVPVIGWPIEADQPFEASYVALSLDAGFELVQVRDGVRGLRPLYRGKDYPSFIQPQGTVEAVREELRDVLRRAWGNEGKIKRNNAEAVKAHLQTAWGADGDSRKSLASLLEQFAAV